MDSRPGQPAPQSGQQVWIAGREAAFCYEWGSGGAVVHYANESDNRVVPLAKLSLTPPATKAEPTDAIPQGGNGMAVQAERMSRGMVCLLDKEPTQAERRTHAARLLEQVRASEETTSSGTNVHAVRKPDEQPPSGSEELVER